MPDQFADRDGHPVNAVYGFCQFLLDFLERAQPSHAAAAFDMSLTTSFRNALYPAYKANRESPPQSLLRQFEYCRELAAALGFVVLADSAYEADDLIGSVAAALRPHGFRASIISADKDFGQLLLGGDEQWDFSRGQRWGAAGVRARLGVAPHQVADFLALAGDKVDNIPGVPGIGAKTAAVLLVQFGDLETLLARIEEIPFLRMRGAASVAAKLRRHADDARLARQLTAIALDAPVPRTPEELRRRAPKRDALESLLDRLGFGHGTRARARALCDG
jgi:5'-3' exonuclease